MSSLRRAHNSDWAQILVDLSAPVICKFDSVTATMLSAERLVLSRDPAKTVADRARLVAAAGDAETPAWVLIYIGSVAGLHERQRDFGLTLSIAHAAVRVAVGNAPLGFPGRPDITAPLTDIDAGRLAIILLWRAGTMIEQPSDLKAWTKLFDWLPSHLAKRALEENHADSLLPYIANRVWIAAAARGTDSIEEWKEVAAALEPLLELGARLESDLLLAAATRALTIVVSERLGRRTEAIAAALPIAQRVSAAWPRFLVLEAVAAQTLYGGDATGAHKLFDEALALAGDSTDIEVVDSYLRAAMAADDASALAYAERAEALAKAMPNAIPTVVARGELETAIALVRAGRITDALAKATSGYEIALVAIETADSARLRTVLAVGGHVLWFLLVRVRSGARAALMLDSGERLTQGMALNARDSLAALTDEAALVRGRGSLCIAAALLGDRSRALTWGKSAWQALQTSSDPLRHSMLPIIADPLCAAALLERRYDTAFPLLSTAFSSRLEASDGDDEPSIDPDLGTIRVVLPAALLALVWDEREGATSAFVQQVGSALQRLRGIDRPNAAAMYDACSLLLEFLSAIPGWRSVHHAPMPDEMYPAKNLVASMADDAAPKVAATLQVLAMEQYADALRAFPTIRTWIIAPALLAYWKRRVSSEPFHFIAPARVQAALDAITGSDENAIRSILAEVVDASAAQNIPARGNAWLRGGTP